MKNSKLKKRLSILCSAVLALSLMCACVFAMTACNKDEAQDIKFKFDKDGTSVMSIGYSVLAGIVIDDDNSYFTLGKDGYIHAKIQTKDIGPLLSGEEELPDVSGDSDLPAGSGSLADMLGDIDLSGFADTYLGQMFPGFSFDDVQASLGLLGGLGFSLVGLDFNDAKIKALADYLKESGGVTPKDMGAYMPDSLVLGIELNCKYSFKDLKDADGNDVRALYIGEYNALSQPFAVMTVKDVNGKMRLTTRIEFIQFNIALNQI